MRKISAFIFIIFALLIFLHKDAYAWWAILPGSNGNGYNTHYMLTFDATTMLNDNSDGNEYYDILIVPTLCVGTNI